MPFMQSDLDILNAEEYNLGLNLPGGRPRRGTKRQLSFNLRESGTSLGVSDPPSNTEDDDVVSRTGATKTSKRTKPAKGTDGEEDKEKKRSRGRPRIDVKDVTAADRRRTQIRLAQRAYRNRKENAIVTLEKKVKSLIETNEAMSNAFMSLHDYAISHGMLEEHPEFARHLRRTTEIFLELARQSSVEADDNDDDEDGDVSKCSGPSRSEAALTAAMATPTPTPTRIHQPTSDRPGVFGYSIHRAPDPSEAFDRTGADHRVQPQQQLYGGLIFSQGTPDGDTADFPRQAMFFDSMSFPGVGGCTSGTSGTSSGMATSSAASPFPGTSPPGGAAVTTTTTGDVSAAATAGPINFSHMFLDSTGFSFFTTPSQQHSPGFGPSNNHNSSNSSSSNNNNKASTHAAQAQAQFQVAAAAAALGSPYESLPMPRMFTSFSLRLRRTALEKAYALAINPNPPPELFARAFGFCVIFDSLDTIRKRLRARIDSPGSSAAAVNWHLPHVSKVLGDTPSTRVTGINMEEMASATHRALKLDPEVEIMMPSFAGSFFDTDETEIYLRQRGVEIPPNSDRITVEVDADDFGGDGTGGAGRSGGASMVASGIESRGYDHRSNNTGHDGTDSSCIEALANVESFNFSSYSSSSGGGGQGTPSDWDTGSVRTGITTATTGSTGAMPGGTTGDSLLSSLINASTLYGHGGGAATNSVSSAGLMSFGSTPKSTGSPIPGGRHGGRSTSPSRRRVVTLDVNKFVHELVMRGTCLGKYPGFRPVDVNDAFWMAARSASV